MAGKTNAGVAVSVAQSADVGPGGGGGGVSMSSVYIVRRLARARTRVLDTLSLQPWRDKVVKYMKAIKRGFCCSLHFSCSRLREKIMSTVERSARKVHWESG